jgi:hypothetical protein
MRDILSNQKYLNQKHRLSYREQQTAYTSNRFLGHIAVL